MHYVEQIAEKYGLRLPPYYCEFNSVELMWHKWKILSEKILLIQNLWLGSTTYSQLWIWSTKTLVKICKSCNKKKNKYRPARSGNKVVISPNDSDSFPMIPILTELNLKIKLAFKVYCRYLRINIKVVTDIDDNPVFNDNGRSFSEKIKI